MIYDYDGFPEKTYHIKYPAPGDPVLADKIYNLLRKSGIDAKLDARRGFDHGVFVPLKVIYPKADIPCVQLSLVRGLAPEQHLLIGKSLSKLKAANILVIGSGFSFHNLQAFMYHDNGNADPRNESFQQWLIDTCTEPNLSENEREQRLMEWESAPFARYCHPREEHLLPLQVCYGMAGKHARLVFDGKIMGKKAVELLW